MQPYDRAVTALLRVAALAAFAFPTGDDGPTNHPMAFGEVIHSGANCMYCTAELVPQRDRKTLFHEFVARGPFIGMQIASADPRRFDPHPKHALTRPTLRIGNGANVDSWTRTEFSDCDHLSPPNAGDSSDDGSSTSYRLGAL